MTNAPLARERRSSPLEADQVLAIAYADAIHAYRDLSGYCIRLALEDDGWHIEYQPKEPRFKGGGPRYVIDPFAGTIISKVYEQ